MQVITLFLREIKRSALYRERINVFLLVSCLRRVFIFQRGTQQLNEEFQKCLGALYLIQICLDLITLYSNKNRVRQRRLLSIQRLKFRNLSRLDYEISMVIIANKTHCSKIKC